MITQGSILIQCRHCPSRAVWATFNTTGRRTLVDPQPATDGNLALEREQGVLIATVIPPKLRGDHTELYRSHFVTCPGADKARVPRRRQTPGRATR